MPNIPRGLTLKCKKGLIAENAAIKISDAAL
jgi:hypothetical protein